MVMSSVGPGTKDNCAGEDQQQLSRPYTNVRPVFNSSLKVCVSCCFIMPVVYYWILSYTRIYLIIRDVSGER
jgi:hypothetical protein